MKPISMSKQLLALLLSTAVPMASVGCTVDAGPVDDDAQRRGR